MSATLSTTVRPAPTNSPGAVLRILSTGFKGIARFFLHRAAIATLRELDDRALSDIGLTRSQIEAAVQGLAVECLMTASGQRRM